MVNRSAACPAPPRETGRGRSRHTTNSCHRNHRCRPYRRGYRRSIGPGRPARSRRSGHVGRRRRRHRPPPCRARCSNPQIGRGSRRRPSRRAMVIHPAAEQALPQCQRTGRADSQTLHHHQPGQCGRPCHATAENCSSTSSLRRRLSLSTARQRQRRSASDWRGHSCGWRWRHHRSRGRLSRCRSRHTQDRAYG